ncbi:MAG: class I SAM-dependent methyltransferase, partial [Hyphomicrobium sp.]
SLYLATKGAEVTALDFAPGAIAQLKKTAAASNLSDKIRAVVYDVTEGWPVPQHSTDLVVDAFCFKHIVGRDARRAYKENLIQALAIRGAYLISFASIGDGYYGRYIVEHCGDGSALAVDPATNLQSVLFTRDHVREFFAPEFKMMEEKFTTEPDHVQGEKITRQTYAMLFERNPKSHGGGYGKVTPETSLMRPRFYGTFPTTDE